MGFPQPHQERPLLEDYKVDELIDPRLGNFLSEQEVCCMLLAALLCIRRDPDECPKISQVRAVMEKYPAYQPLFAKLSYGEGQMLDKAFYEEEVKRFQKNIEAKLLINEEILVLLMCSYGGTRRSQLMFSVEPLLCMSCLSYLNITCSALFAIFSYYR